MAEFRGRQAYLQILDYAAVEPWGWHAAPRYPEDDWGFILVDDIRQTDGAADPRRVDEAGDRARNFDFESLLPERFTVDAAALADGGGGVFEIHDREQGRVVGALHCTAAVTRRATGPDAGDGDRGVQSDPRHTGTALLWHVAFTWRYQGETLSGVKLRLTSRLPVAAADASYTLHPGLLYDGNPTAEACHYLGEDLPEAAATVPAGFSVEDAAWVFAGWVEPQRRAADPAASVRLQVDPASGRYEAVHQLPESAVFGRRLLLDSDERLTLSDGACYRKTLYLYAAARRAGTVFRPGYCDVLSAAWRQLYPVSPTNPPHSLRSDYELRLRTTLDDHGLIQEIARGGRTYRVFYVGRWVYGDAPTGGGRFLPKEYFHRFVGFSWSGMAGLVAHAALDYGLQHDDADAVRVAVDTMDFFAEHGMAPLGILYPTYHEDHAGMVAGRAELAHRGQAALAQRPLPVRGAGAGAARLQPRHPVRRRLPRRRYRGRAAGVALPRQLDHQVRRHPEHVHARRGARRRPDPEPLRRHHLPSRCNPGAGLGRRPEQDWRPWTKYAPGATATPSPSKPATWCRRPPATPPRCSTPPATR